MNKQPVSYLQTDPRWSKLPYRVTGETATIGGSGCGPSCAAMLIETLTGQAYTPEDACNWSMAHGYKALNQGTYYSYFVPQFAAFGIACKQLNSASLYGNSASTVHTTAFDLLKQGYYLIACMGPGLWTSSGHFIVAWWEDGKVRINDPASTKDARLNGDPATFKAQVKYYWAIDARKYNNAPTDVTAMTATGTVTATALNVRSGPGTAYSILGSLKQGAAVAITGSSGGWYRIQYNGSAAWVSGQYITIAAPAAPATTPTVNEEDDEMTLEQFSTMMDTYLTQRSQLADAAWGDEWNKAKSWVENNGIVAGDTKGNKQYQTWTTKQMMALMLYRSEQLQVRYNKLTDIPEAYDFRNIINLLMDVGIIQGQGNDVIDLSQDMVRMLIYNYRAGCYDEKILEAGYNPELYK